MRVDDDRIALPLRACQDYVGSVIDDAGGEVLVVDVNGDLPDHVVQARTVMLVRAVNSGARRAADSSAANASYQGAVAEWMLACFGEAIARDRMERNHRFLEESLELVQSLGCSASEAHQLVDYVFGRLVGEPGQEVGGVCVTLAALCNAASLSVAEESECELTRISSPAMIENIRAKQAAKPASAPLPAVPS